MMSVAEIDPKATFCAFADLVRSFRQLPTSMKPPHRCEEQPRFRRGGNLPGDSAMSCEMDYFVSL
jgi:hypothetical protein